MALTSIDRETTISGALAALRAVGIEPPALPEYTDLPACPTTVEDIAEAVFASKAADPYSDHKVQKAWTARQIGTSSWLYEANRAKQSTARAQALLDNRPALTAHSAAQQLTAAAEIIGDRSNLNELSPAVDRPEEVHAALDVRIAEQAIAEVLRVRSSLDSLTGPRMENGGDTEIFGWANPTPAERRKVQALGRETVWNTARAGVDLTFAADREELATRVREHHAAQERERAAQARQAEANRRTR